MKITYDKLADAMYIKFQDGAFVSNKEVEEGIILDVGKKGVILGIEILEASHRLKSKELLEMGTATIVSEIVCCNVICSNIEVRYL